jgi:hypothetical protein
MALAILKSPWSAKDRLVAQKDQEENIIFLYFLRHSSGFVDQRQDWISDRCLQAGDIMIALYWNWGNNNKFS